MKNRSFIWNIYGKSEAFEYFCPLSVHYLTQWSSFEYLWRVILEPDFTCCFLLVEIMLISSSHTGDINVTMCTDCRVFVVVFNATFYNISVISWRSLNGFQLQTSFMFESSQKHPYKVTSLCSRTLLFHDHIRLTIHLYLFSYLEDLGEDYFHVICVNSLKIKVPPSA